MTETRIKICGLTRPLPEEALAGVHYVGLNAVPSSRRFVSPHEAAQVVAALPPGIETVLVVANASADHVRPYLAACRVDWLQFHGAERPTDCRVYARPYFKAFPATPGVETSLSAYLDYGLLLVDAPGTGGRGEPADLAVVRHVVSQASTHAARVLVAGGLSAATVGDVIRQVRPYGVDVASGVESAPGVKDPARIRDFVAAVQEAQA